MFPVQVGEQALDPRKFFNRRAEIWWRMREFVQNGGHWYFIDPSVPLKASRNDPCPCAGGQKFKKCCANYLA